MQRTNIYLEERQLSLLRNVSRDRGASVAELVREAIDGWLKAQGVREVDADEWDRRFDELLSRRRASADELGLDPEVVDRDVMDVVREVRSEHAARRR